MNETELTAKYPEFSAQIDYLAPRMRELAALVTRDTIDDTVYFLTEYADQQEAFHEFEDAAESRKRLARIQELLAELDHVALPFYTEDGESFDNLCGDLPGSSSSWTDLLEAYLYYTDARAPREGDAEDASWFRRQTAIDRALAAGATDDDAADQADACLSRYGFGEYLRYNDRKRMEKK